MTNYPDRDELARELFMADNARQSRNASLTDWEALKQCCPDEPPYTYALADAALALFKAANPKPKKAKGGKITGPPPGAGVPVMLSGASITDQVKDALGAPYVSDTPTGYPAGSIADQIASGRLGVYVAPPRQNPTHYFQPSHLTPLEQAQGLDGK